MTGKPILHALTLLSLSIAVAACGSDSTGANNPPPAADVVIQQGAAGLGNQAFQPSPFTISLAADGGTVTWRDDDSQAAHTISENNGVFDFDNVTRGSTRTFTFTAPGTYNYHCDIHPSMVGQIVVNP